VVSFVITASLVLYCNKTAQFSRAIASYLNSCNGEIDVIDNSPEPLECDYFLNPRVHYLHVGRNLGFGAGHNLALRRVLNASDFHVVLNPDVEFESNVIPALVELLEADENAGVVMPRIDYPDGSLQNLCKLLPTPRDLFLRRFSFGNSVRKRLNDRYELHGLSQVKTSIVPSLSGCFLVFRTDVLRQVGIFDERYFMYMEDVDLVRRVGDRARTLYHPLVTVRHDYAKGSYKNRRLLRFHIISAVRYFFKWGWVFDPVRTARNRNALGLLKRRACNGKK